MCMKLYQYVFVAMYIFSLRYLIVFSVLTITAFLEDAIRIFEECLPKIGEVKTCIQCVASLTFVFFFFRENRRFHAKSFCFGHRLCTIVIFSLH